MNRSALLLLFSVTGVSVAATDDSVAGLLHREDVRSELKLTAAQKARWESIDRVRDPQRGGTFESDPVVLTDPALQEKKDAEREKKAWTIVSPDQAVRLHELFIQRVGVRAVLREEVRWTLELTDPQADEVRRAKSKRDLALRNLYETSQRVKLDPKRVQDILDNVDKELVEDLKRVLTGDQAEKLSKSGGRPFHFMDRKVG